MKGESVMESNTNWLIGELTIKKDSRTNRNLRYAGRGVVYYKTEEISSKSSRKMGNIEK